MTDRDVNLESIIDRVLKVRGARPNQYVQLQESEVHYLCHKARELLVSQPILLELEVPIKVRLRPSILSVTPFNIKAPYREFSALIRG